MHTEPQKRNLIITRVFNAPVEQVWKAWVEPEMVKQWWGPAGFTCPLAKMDFRAGGTSLVCMSSPDFGEHYSTWQYEQIVPLERIEYVHNLANRDGHKIDPASVGMPPDFPQDQRHIITFKELGNNKTELTVTEYGWTVGQMMEMSKMGMEQCLDKMAAIFEQHLPRMYGLIGKMTAVSGQRDALISILLEGIADMPGCLSYIIAKDPAEVNVIWLTEAWDSAQSHQASLSLPSVQRAIDQGKALIASFDRPTVTEPVGGHGLAATDPL